MAMMKQHVIDEKILTGHKEMGLITECCKNSNSSIVQKQMIQFKSGWES